MKNTLAENMLRFGVKNLKETDLKKISEALLTEEVKPWQPWKAINPKSWKIKSDTNENAAGLIVTPALYPVGNLNSTEATEKRTYGMWCLEKSPGYTGTDRYQLRQDARITLQNAAVDLVTVMAANGVYNVNAYKDYVTAVKAANVTISKLRGAFLSYLNTPDVLGQDKYWMTNSYNKAENMKQSEWEAILPLLKIGIDSFIAKYVVAPVAAPVKAAVPGTPAPTKKN
jgi:hypothetical protein